MKLPYFKIGEAFTTVKDEFAYGDTKGKASAIAKLAGKTAANIGMLGVELGVGIIKNAPQHIGDAAEKKLANDKSISAEQKERLEQLVEKGREHNANKGQ